mgnify:CR=1 FL=1
MDLLTWSAPVAAAITLAALWVLESFYPLLRGRKDRSRRAARHFVLAGLNAGTAVLFSGATLGVVTLGERYGFGVLRWLNLERLADDIGPTLVGLAWAGLAFVLLDGWHWAFHVIAHKTPWLWKFHAVHHTDPEVDATTAMRFHCGEIAVQCLASLPVYLLLGVSMSHILLYQLVLLPMAMFHHANLDLSPRVDRWLRAVIVTPRMHLMHHSRWTPETDSNYAAVLSWWDHLLGTYSSARDPQQVDTGLDGIEPRHVEGVRGMLSQPLSKAKSQYGRPPAEPGDDEPMAQAHQPPPLRDRSGAARSAPRSVA